MAEDFVTVYYHDGTHKMFFVNDIERIHMSKIDLNNVTYDDYRSQVVETTYGTFVQMINQIDSVVFSHVDMAYPRTEEELKATTQLASYITVRTNDIVDSLKNEGKREPELIVKEFMKIPGVIDAEVNEGQSSITILCADSTYHDFVFDYWSKSQVEINDTIYNPKASLISNNQSFFARVSKKQTEIAPVHEEGESKILKEIKNVLILAPYQNLPKDKGGLSYDIDDYSSFIKQKLNVTPEVVIDKNADITKFYGENLEKYDMIIILTHGRYNAKNGVRFGSSTIAGGIGDVIDRWFGDLPEICWMSLEGNSDSYLCMSPKFLNNAYFKGSLVFAFACSSYDEEYAKSSMVNAFLDHGASSYLGFSETSNTLAVKNYGINVINSLVSGISLQDAVSYWKTSSPTKVFLSEYNNLYEIDKTFTEKDKRCCQPEIFILKQIRDYPFYLKSPYPHLLQSNVNNNKIDLSWEDPISSYMAMIKQPIIKKDEWVLYGYTYYPTYDVFVNGVKINNEELTETSISWTPNMSGTYKWHVVSKLKSEDYDEYISAFKSKEYTFTVENFPTLSLSSNSLVISALTCGSVQITSGSGSYSIESIYPTGIVTASISGNTVTIDALTAGSAKITIKDNKSGQTQTIDVTVTGESPSMDGEIVMERKYYVDSRGDVSTSWEGGRSNNYAYQQISLSFDNNKRLSINYLNAYYWDDSRKTQRKGVYIISYDGGKKVKEWYIQPRKDKEWIKEKIVVSKDGKVSYFSNDTFMGEEIFENLSLDGAKNVTVDLDPYGWWYTHYHYMDDFVITTPATVVKDDFNDGVLDLNIWQSPANPDGVREENGFLKAEQIRTDKDFHLRSKPIPLVGGNGGTEPVSILSCPDDHHPHLIDLGLPSGTKWACCNVGTSTPEGYGGYYAWGETEEKTTYYWKTYIHCNGSSSSCHDLGSDIAGTQYDVAHVKWGGAWVMPSYDQQTELHKNCSSEWITLNGIKGRIFTGPSGASIFLPASGSRMYKDFDDVGSVGHYWSSSQDPSGSYYAYTLYFHSGTGNVGWGHVYRFSGQSVRPVSR